MNGFRNLQGFLKRPQYLRYVCDPLRLVHLAEKMAELDQGDGSVEAHRVLVAESLEPVRPWTSSRDFLAACPLDHFRTHVDQYASVRKRCNPDIARGILPENVAEYSLQFLSVDGDRPILVPLAIQSHLPLEDVLDYMSNDRANLKSH